MRIPRRRFLTAGISGLVAGGLLGGCRNIGFHPIKLLRPSPSNEVIARGRVTCRGQPLSGVRVSDGLSVVTTDQHGMYELGLQLDSGPFVFVVTPSGYWTESFWEPIQRAVEGNVDFELTRFEQEKSYDFLFLTDVHLGEGSDPARSFRRFRHTLDEIAALRPAPAFVWFGGDMTIRNGWGPRFRALARSLDLPVRFCIGDHDLRAWRPNPRAEYEFLFGPSYYSFDWGGVHYVALDGCKVVTTESGAQEVHGEMSARELAWLEEDLRLVPRGMPTVVSVHIPIVSTHPRRRGTSPEEAPHLVFRNSDEILGVLRRYEVPLVLQGHLHENERITVGATEFAKTVAVAGKSWSSTGQEHGVSGEPRGYRRVSVHGVRVSHRYVSSAESRVDVRGEVVGNPALLPRAEAVPILLNLYDGPGNAVVTARADDGPWSRISPFSPVGAVPGLQMAHHWLWTVDTREWDAGSHILQFRVDAGNGTNDVLQHRVEVL